MTIGSVSELASSGLENIKVAMSFDPNIAWYWHSALASTFIYEGACHYQAHKAAAKFIQLKFGIDVTKFKDWNELESYWKKVGRGDCTEQQTRAVNKMKKIEETKIRTGYVICVFTESDVIPSYFKLDDDDNGSWDWTVDPQAATRFKNKTEALQILAVHAINTANAFVFEANLTLDNPVHVADLGRAILQAELDEAVENANLAFAKLRDFDSNKATSPCDELEKFDNFDNKG